MKKILIAILAVLILILGLGFRSYCQLSSMDEAVMQKWAQIETQMQAGLENSEEKLAISRAEYNAYVKKLNERITSLPDSLFAGSLGFHVREYLQEEKAAVDSKEDNL